MLVYSIKTKSGYYVGKTINFADIKSTHLYNLRQGKHSNDTLQKIYDEGKDFAWTTYPEMTMEDVKGVLEWEGLKPFETSYQRLKKLMQEKRISPAALISLIEANF